MTGACKLNGIASMALSEEEWVAELLRRITAKHEEKMALDISINQTVKEVGHIPTTNTSEVDCVFHFSLKRRDLKTSCWRDR